MSSKNRQKPILVQTLSAEVNWTSVGLDLAKFDLSVVGLSDSDQIYGIDRIAYDKFFEMTVKLKPTIFSMEPCNGARVIAQQLRNQGHQVRMISGNAVSTYVETHLGAQKNDINDAQALAFLNLDKQLIPIREKTPHEARLLTLFSIRKHYVEERSSTITAFKGLMQSWGISIKRSMCSLKNLKAFVLDHTGVLEPAVTDALLSMIEEIEVLNHRITEMNKRINEEISKDERHALIRTMPFIGPTTECRLLATVGDISRFSRPRHMQAFYGLVPRNLATGHNGRSGRMSKRGDKEMRTQLVECASVIYMAYAKGRFPDCGIKKWIDKKVDSGMRYGLLISALAGKLSRILWALLVHGQEFDIKRAGLSREAIKTMGNYVVDTETGVVVKHLVADEATMAIPA